MVHNPLNFTDNFGIWAHGPEFHFGPKSPQLVAAEGCFSETTDTDMITMLQQPPCRMITAGEYILSPKQTVSCLFWY